MVDRRTDDDDSCFPILSLEVRKTGLDCGIQSVWVDLLEEVVSLERGGGDCSPVDCPGVVDEYVYSGMDGDDLVD